MTQQNFGSAKNKTVIEEKSLTLKCQTIRTKNHRKATFTGDPVSSRISPVRFPTSMFLHLFLLFQHQKNQGSALSQREPGSVRMGGSYKVAISGGRNEILDSK